MTIRLLFITWVALAAFGGSVSVRASPSDSPENVPALLSGTDMQDTLESCQNPGVNPYTIGTAVPEDRLTIGAPPGLALTPMAFATAERLPLPPGQLSLARMEYSPKTGTETRRASGPMLFVVESGTVDIFRGGEQTRLGPGTFALVQAGQRYAFVNDSSDVASLLRLALTPRDLTDKPVADFITITPTPGPALKPPARTWLFRGELHVFPPEPVELFIACSVWTSTSDNASTYRTVGPVGLKLAEGSLHLGENVTLATGGCALFDLQDVYQLQTGDGPARGMLFGILPSGQDLWLPSSDGATQTREQGVNVNCGNAP